MPPGQLLSEGAAASGRGAGGGLLFFGPGFAISRVPGPGWRWRCPRLTGLGARGTGFGWGGGEGRCPLTWGWAGRVAAGPLSARVGFSTLPAARKAGRFSANLGDGVVTGRSRPCLQDGGHRGPAPWPALQGGLWEAPLRGRVGAGAWGTGGVLGVFPASRLPFCQLVWAPHVRLAPQPRAGPAPRGRAKGAAPGALAEGPCGGCTSTQVVFAGRAPGRTGHPDASQDSSSASVPGHPQGWAGAPGGWGQELVLITEWGVKSLRLTPHLDTVLAPEKHVADDREG